MRTAFELARPRDQRERQRVAEAHGADGDDCVGRHETTLRTLHLQVNLARPQWIAARKASSERQTESAAAPVASTGKSRISNSRGPRNVIQRAVSGSVAHAASAAHHERDREQIVRGRSQRPRHARANRASEQGRQIGNPRDPGRHVGRGKAGNDGRNTEGQSGETHPVAALRRSRCRAWSELRVARSRECARRERRRPRELERTAPRRTKSRSRSRPLPSKARAITRIVTTSMTPMLSSGQRSRDLRCRWFAPQGSRRETAPGSVEGATRGRSFPPGWRPDMAHNDEQDFRLAESNFRKGANLR